MASACPTPESACVPQVNVCTSQSGILCAVERNVGCLKMFAVLVCACADLLFVSAAQRSRIICSRPLVNRKALASRKEDPQGTCEQHCFTFLILDFM